LLGSMNIGFAVFEKLFKFCWCVNA
jgi:hypothetical protein